MRNYQLSNERGKVLDGLVKEGVFPNANAALADAVDNYLAHKKQALVIIDPQAADNNAHRTQDQWIAFFNGQGRPMISAPDTYGAGKSAPRDVLDSLRSDFDISWEVSSTRTSYAPNDLSGRITHNFGSTVVKPQESTLAQIPVYQGREQYSFLD